ncbi:hypothetical protein AB0G74_30495 [Streptomyces sp. NPDC020875]|uniref:hypothetical protein n=1 Tax=Streptomyces sp. NPDC020875 TaxID=3154898 RepID=UPI0033DC36D7
MTTRAHSPAPAPSPAAPPDGMTVCYICDGTGRERNQYYDGHSGCPTCLGEPPVVQCHLCEGTGSVRREDPDW